MIFGNDHRDENEYLRVVTFLEERNGMETQVKLKDSIVTGFISKYLSAYFGKPVTIKNIKRDFGTQREPIKETLWIVTLDVINTDV